MVSRDHHTGEITVSIIINHKNCNIVDFWAASRVPLTSDLVLFWCGKLPRLQLLSSFDSVLGRGTFLVLGVILGLR